jgi:hypothetical protein
LRVSRSRYASKRRRSCYDLFYFQFVLLQKKHAHYEHIISK